MTNLCIGFCTHGRCYHLDCPAASASSLCQRPGRCSRVPQEQIFRNFNSVMLELTKKQYKQNYDSVISELNTKQKCQELISKMVIIRAITSKSFKTTMEKSEKEKTKPEKIPLEELMSAVKPNGFWFQKALIGNPEIRKQYGKIYVWNWANDDRLWTEADDPRLNSVNLNAVHGIHTRDNIVFVTGYLEQYIKTQPIPVPTKETIFLNNLRRVFHTGGIPR